MKPKVLSAIVTFSFAWCFCSGFVSLLANESASSVASQASAKRPPNIVFIFCDDHAYQAIGAYGSKLVETPNIDLLAKQGMRFDRCLVTNSICGPCRATILSGKYSHKNGFLTNNNGVLMVRK